MLTPATKLLVWPNIRSEVAACPEPPNELVAVQVRSISPNTLVPSSPVAGTVCPVVVMRFDSEPLRFGKQSTAGSGHPVFCASVPLPSKWFCRNDR